MKAYGSAAWRRKELPWKAMCYTLLHAQDALRTAWMYKPEWKNCTSMKELETTMWGFLADQ